MSGRSAELTGDAGKRRRASYSPNWEAAWDDALPKDYENVGLTSLSLKFKYRGKNAPKLTDAFQKRNGERYHKFLAIWCVLLLVANITFIAYDVFRHGNKDEGVLTSLIIIRIAVIIPSNIAMLAFTMSRWYKQNAEWLIVPCTVFGIGMVVYSIVGRDPGYGTLALMIVFAYSFTPISFVPVSAMSLVLIASFVALMFGFFDGSDPNLLSPGEVMGMLLLFWLAVAVVGHNLEHSLRRSFLDELIIRRHRDMLKTEKSLSDRLLGNMLPKSIAAQLKEGRRVVADEFDEVTVLFCEICDWARITEQISAESVVSVLNHIYSRFDKLIEDHNVYKVETVGEVYMIVGGCPRRAKSHGRDCARMALAMMDCVPSLRREVERDIGEAGRNLNIRIGLNSGPIVAGIVGIKNPRYKLFGDTVNTASRMESTSIPGKIQCSDKTFPHLRNHFRMTARGGIPVKGKGIMQTHFVEAPLANVPVEEAEVQAAPLVKKHGSDRSMSSRAMNERMCKSADLSGTRFETKEDPLRAARTQRLSAGHGTEDSPDVMPQEQTEKSGEMWAGNGAAAAQAARELFQVDDDIGDMQHLVDIFARHDDERVSSAEVDEDEEDVGDMHASAEVGEAGAMGSPTPSFHIPRGAAHHTNDMSIEDLEASHAIINISTVNAEQDSPPRGGPPRTFSAHSKNIMTVVHPPIDERDLSDPRKISPSARSRARSGTDDGGRTRRPRRSRVTGWTETLRLMIRESARAVCMYRSSDTKYGALEDYFQAAHAQSWRRFVRMSAIIAVVALGMFAIQDLFKFDRKVQRQAQRHDLIMIIRYAVLCPILLAYFALTHHKSFVDGKHYWLVQISTCVTVILMGAGIIVVSLVGGEPGFGVLAAFVVYVFNLSLLSYGLRALSLAVLIAAHMVCIVTIGGVTDFSALEHFGYLSVFYIGQGLPVMGREFYNRDNYMRREKLTVQQRQLKVETKRTDRLLENLLPKQIARKLKDGDTNIAAAFNRATILFTDMKGFTAFSSNITPTQLVGFLNTMYSKFDLIANKYGIHKVEIIGDAYFSVAGCPSEMPDHAERCAAAAVEMLGVMPELRQLAGAEITMRVGIHTGPLVAGVVGMKDPRYHLFGHTVNLAMQMESNGVPGKVHISDQTYAWLKHRFALAKEKPQIHDEFHRLAGPGTFVFEERGSMDILGSQMHTYFIDRLSSDQSLPGNTPSRGAGLVVGQQVYRR